MAAAEPKPTKQLRELLQEQQEPFILEIYLVERGYLKKNLNSESRVSCCHGNSRKSLKRSVSCHLNISKKGIPHRFKVLRTVCNQIISIKERLRMNSSNHIDRDLDVSGKGRNCQEVAESERFSSASSVTVFNSCSESDIEEISTSWQKGRISFTAHTSQSLRLCNTNENEAITDRKLQWHCIEDNKRLSPVSVLEEIPSQADKTEDVSITKEENPSKTCAIFPQRVTEDSILLASLWKALFHSATEPIRTGVTEMQQLVQSSVSSHCLKPKMVLQQTRQLLFDCVREVVETQGKRTQQQHQKEYLGSEELRMRIGVKIKSWEKQSGEESNLKKLFNLLESAQEWINYETQRRDIVLEIGETIVEELRNEIVMYMIDFSSPI